MNTLQALQDMDCQLFDYDLMAGQSVEWTQIKAHNRDGELESYRIVGAISENPGMYALMKYASATKAWTWYEVWTSWQEAERTRITQEHEAAGMAAGMPSLKPIVKSIRNTEHKQVHISLCDRVTVTCEETGITYTVDLPIPAALNERLNLALVHPFAYPESVKKAMQQFSKTGQRIEQALENQVLAGMLLTILRSKGLLICKDAPKANLFLQAASRDTLGYACRWFSNRNSTVNFPALALHLGDARMVAYAMRELPLSEREKAMQQAEFFILNYMKACKGESNLDEAAHVVVSPKKTAKPVKVYTDPLQAQVKEAESAEKKGLYLLSKLVAEYPGQHSLMFDRIKSTLKILSYASQKVRDDIAIALRTTFLANTDAIELAVLFSAVKQDAIEDDLLSFTHMIEADKAKWDGQAKVKVDFLSKLRKQA